MKAREIYECATSYTKIKSQQIVETLYTEFTPWQGLLDFQPVLRTPTGTTLTFQHDPAMIVGVGRFQDHDVAIIAQQTPPSIQARKDFNYGLVQADGYGLALCMMHYAEGCGSFRTT
jgi:acetyl-CoA carboxylase alpha subunit